MRDEFITQCPNCSTSFKVKDVQLNAAAGAVRCGACLMVFQATEYMLREADEDIVKEQSSDEDKNVNVSSQLAAPNVEGSYFPEAKISEPVHGDDVENEIENEHGAAPSDAPSEDLRSLANDNDSDMQSMPSPSDSSADELAAYQERLSIEFQISDRQDVIQNADELLVSDGSTWAAGSEEIAVEALDDARIDETSSIEVLLTQGQQEQSEQALLESEAEADTFSLGPAVSDYGDKKVEVIESDETLSQSVSEHGAGNDRDEIAFPLNDDFMAGEPISININVEPEPVELDHSTSSVFPLKQVLWTAFSLLLMMSLVMQFGWFNRNELSQRLELREVYLQACEHMNCQLTDFVDGDALAISDLVVRTHPTIDRSLIVDAILRNTAPYEQKFPRLELQFSDINGRAMAAREFSPSEYLGGELTGRGYIPAATEVRLSLEIVDPGSKAVGHALSVLVN